MYINFSFTTRIQLATSTVSVAPEGRGSSHNSEMPRSLATHIWQAGEAVLVRHCLFLPLILVACVYGCMGVIVSYALAPRCILHACTSVNIVQGDCWYRFICGACISCPVCLWVCVCVRVCVCVCTFIHIYGPASLSSVMTYCCEYPPALSLSLQITFFLNAVHIYTHTIYYIIHQRWLAGCLK